MKRFYVFLLIVFLSAFAWADELETLQYTAKLISTADTNAVALDVNTSSWAVCQNWVGIPSKFNGLKVMFYAYGDGVGGGDPNNKTFSYQFYVADYGGAAQLVASGTATVGAMQLSHNPISLAELNSGSVDPNYCWIDTLGAITTDWKSGVSTQNDGGTNDAASFIFDRESAKVAWCRIYDITNLTTVYCIAYGY